MALAEYVNTLDDLLKEDVNGDKEGFEYLKGYAQSNFQKRSLDADKKIYSEIIGAMKEYLLEKSRGLLDTKDNGDLWTTLGNFISKALKGNKDPSQLYGKILDVFYEEVFNRKEGKDLVNLIILSKIYMNALYITRNINPITKQYDRSISREDKEKAAKTIAIVKELLAEAIYRYWSSRGEKITWEEIIFDLEHNAKDASSFYAIWEGARDKIINEIRVLTRNDELKEAFTYLVLKLEDSYLSFIKGLMARAYNARPVPEYIINVLEELNSKDFLKNAFSEMYNEIGNYINQLQPQIAQELQLNQPAGQHQGGQQGNQPQQSPQPPAGQQPAPQQQQANQPQQNNQQGQQTP
jgi:hypothetical protein